MHQAGYSGLNLTPLQPHTCTNIPGALFVFAVWPGTCNVVATMDAARLATAGRAPLILRTSKYTHTATAPRRRIAAATTALPSGNT